MAKLIYFTPTSLAGYIADETGNPDWAAPDEEIFAFINDLARPIGMYLYGRKIYETMAIWETPDVTPGRPSTNRSRPQWLPRLSARAVVFADATGQ